MRENISISFADIGNHEYSEGTGILFRGSRRAQRDQAAKATRSADATLSLAFIVVTR